MLKEEQVAPSSGDAAPDIPSDKELELGREIGRLKLEVARLTKKADQVDFAFDLADQAREDKMNYVRAINREREEMVRLSKAHIAQEGQLKATSEQAQKLQSKLNVLLARVDDLEAEREQMESAMSEIESIAQEKEMKALKTGRLVGKITAKLQAQTKDRLQQANATKEASIDVRTQMTDLMSGLSTTAALVETFANVKKFVKKLMAQLKNSRLASPRAVQQEHHAYPPGTSFRTTATEMEAMVAAGKLSADQMHEVLVAQRDEDRQDRADTYPDRPRQCQDQASQCNLGESGMNAADDLLRNARRQEVDGSRHRDPANGRWIAGFWFPEPWCVGLTQAENSAATAVGSKLRYAHAQTSFSARDGTSRSDGGFDIVRGTNLHGRVETRRRVADVQPLDPRSDHMRDVVGIHPPKPPPVETRKTYHERTGTPRLPLLAPTQLVNEVRTHPRAKSDLVNNYKGLLSLHHSGHRAAWPSSYYARWPDGSASQHAAALDLHPPHPAKAPGLITSTR